MKTPYSEIVNTNFIGAKENPIDMNELLQKADTESLNPAKEDKEKVLFLAIDVQNDFMENGSLGVPGAHGDVERITKFIYDNMDKISNIAVSIDTHKPHQIFHPCWWIDENGKHPDPYTVITKADLDAGKWRAIISPVTSIEYVEGLEKTGKVLCVWPYHCLQGTFGHSLESQFMNMVYFHSVAKRTTLTSMTKGNDPMTEMYGVFKKEFDYGKNYINIDMLNKFANYDKIVVVGEAKSHCVLESIKQMLEHYKTFAPETTKKVYILEDCMSSIPGYEDTTNKTFDDFKKSYGVNIVKSTEFSLN